MAVDNRNFVNKFANEGGGDVLVEDKRMEELKSATAKTSSQISTSDNYIPLQDTDGNLVKINPASFEEAVRNVLGGLLANNDKGTTISGIPALSGSGNSLDFGSITPANLASVLGVANIRNMTVKYEVGVQDASRNPGGSTNYFGHVTILDALNYGFEIAYATFDSSGDTTKDFYWRQWYNNDPLAWKKIECTII